MLTRVAQYIRRCLPATISKKHIIVFLIVFVSLSAVLFVVDVRSVYAQTMLESVADGILNVLTKVSLFFARLCMAMAIFFLRFFIQLGAYNGFLDAPIVRLGWVMLRDIANMFFVVALLVIAFATILGRESYEWKKAMVKLVLMAIVVNFSLLICGIILDAVHVFTVTFINAIAPVAAGNLITMFNFQSMQSIITNSGGGQAGDLDLALFGGAAIALFFSALAALTIGAYCVILLYRMVAIWSLLIFSPLAFVLSVLPATENYFEEWKSEFTKNVLSAPIAVFFLWLAFATMGANTGANSAVEHLNQNSSGFQIQDVSVGANAAGDVVASGIGAEAIGANVNSISINAASTWSAMAGFLVSMAFLIKGIEQVQSLGVRGSGWLDSAQSFVKNVMTIGSGVALGGWLLGKGKDFTGSTLKNVGLSVGTQTGMVQTYKRIFTGKGLFAGAGARAEARLERLDEEKSNKEAMQKSIGRSSRTFGDVMLNAVGLKSAGQSLAKSAVLSELAEHESHKKEEEEKIESEKVAREGKYDNKILPAFLSRFGGGDIAHRFDHAAEHDIKVTMKQEGLDAMKNKLVADKKIEAMETDEYKALQAEKLRTETREHAASETEKEIATDIKQAAYAGEHGHDLEHDLRHSLEHAVRVGLKEEGLKSTEDEIGNVYTKAMRIGVGGMIGEDDQMLLALANNLEDSDLDELVSEEEQGRIKQVLKDAIQSGDKDSINNALLEASFLSPQEKKDIEKAIEGGKDTASLIDGIKVKTQQKIKKDLTATAQAFQESQAALVSASTDEEKDRAKEEYNKAREALDRAVGSAQSSMKYQTRRKRELDIAAGAGLTMTAASLRKIKADESSGDAKDAREGMLGEYNVAYALSEDNAVKRRMNAVDRKLFEDRMRGPITAAEDAAIKAAIEAAEKAAIEAAEKAAIEAAEKNAIEVAKDTARLNDFGRASKLMFKDMNTIKKQAEITALLKKHSGNTALMQKEIIATAVKEHGFIEGGVDEDAIRKTIDVEKVKKSIDIDKAKQSVSVDTEAIRSSVVLSSITDQARALAYQRDGIFDDFVKISGEYYAKAQQKSVKKFEAVSKKLTAIASDNVRGEEGKRMDEVNELLREEAKKIIANGSQFGFEEHARQLSIELANIQRMRQIEKQKDGKLNEEEKKLLQNATRNMGELVTAGMSQFGKSFGVMLNMVDGFASANKSVAMASGDNIATAVAALMSGKSFDDMKKQVEAQGEQIINEEYQRVREKYLKEKADSYDMAFQDAFNNSKVGAWHSQFIQGYNQNGRRVRGFIKTAKSGVHIGDRAAFTTGTSKDGQTVQGEMSVSNVLGSMSAEKITSLGDIFSFGGNYGLSDPHKGRSEEIAQNIGLIRSGQLGSDDWRRMGGGSGDGGAYKDGKWTIRQEAWGQYFKNAVNTWYKIYTDRATTPSDRADIKRRLQLLLAQNGVKDVKYGVSVASASTADMFEFLQNQEMKFQDTDKTITLFAGTLGGGNLRANIENIEKRNARDEGNDGNSGS